MVINYRPFCIYLYIFSNFRNPHYRNPYTFCVAGTNSSSGCFGTTEEVQTTEVTTEEPTTEVTTEEPTTEPTSEEPTTVVTTGMLHTTFLLS